MAIDLTAYDALSFDCYGTLIDWEAGMAAAMALAAHRHDPSLGADALLAAYAEQESAVEEEHPSMRYPDVLAESFRRTGTALGVEVTDEDAAALGTSVGDWPAFPDSPEALARLKARYRLIILSNVHRDGFAASNERLGVAFDAILTAEDIGSYKPDPANFDALLARTSEMGIPDGRLLHVAQSLFHDHVPAKAAGLPTVWIDRRRDKPGWGATPEPAEGVTPDLVFPSMVAFANAVDAAFDAAPPTSPPD